jgi:hypothetical protein
VGRPDEDGLPQLQSFPREDAAHRHSLQRRKGSCPTIYLLHRPSPHERRERSYRGQLVAALSLHIDKDATAPVIVNNLAIRGDTPDHTDLSRAAAGWMMAYLLEVARQDNRPLEVGVEIDTQPNRDDFEAIGFRPSATPPAYTAPYLAFRVPY